MLIAVTAGSAFYPDQCLRCGQDLTMPPHDSSVSRSPGWPQVRRVARGPRWAAARRATLPAARPAPWRRFVGSSSSRRGLHSVAGTTRVAQPLDGILGQRRARSPAPAPWAGYRRMTRTSRASPEPVDHLGIMRLLALMLSEQEPAHQDGVNHRPRRGRTPYVGVAA